MCRYSEMTLEDKNLNRQKEATYIINAVQKKIHLQTLWALTEVQKMTPRERMQLRKVQAADEEARKLKKLVEEKYEENNKRMQELRSWNFQQLTVDVLHEFDDPASENLPESQPIPSLELGTLGSSVEDTVADLGDHEIPEDPLVAEGILMIHLTPVLKKVKRERKRSRMRDPSLLTGQTNRTVILKHWPDVWSTCWAAPL